MNRTTIGLKIFTATHAASREALSGQVTTWIREHPELDIVDKVVTQLPTSELLTITVVYLYVR